MSKGAPSNPNPRVGAPTRGFESADGLVAEASPGVQSSRLAYSEPAKGIFLYHGNALEVMDAMAAKHPDGCFDVIFADPPYFLSNGGITCHAGRMVRVDKGDWDKSRGAEENHHFNREWLRRCQALLKPNGTIFVSGTHHVIFSVGFAMQQLGMKLLNQITWQKPNPPPNLACRYFTHSTETVLWAAKNEKSRHRFHYGAMKVANHGKQMKDVWSFTAPKSEEKKHGKHPTQKPLALLERILVASTDPGDWVLDPFMGSGTTAVACARLRRNCVGIESDPGHVKVAERRIREVEAGYPARGEMESRHARHERAAASGASPAGTSPKHRQPAQRRAREDNRIQPLVIPEFREIQSDR